MDTQKLTVAEVLLKELFKLGVEYVFLVPGAQIIPFLLKLYEENKHEIPTPIIASHELAAGFMALGYARASGKIGVAFSIGGPGAAYMVGAAVTAKADNVPVFFITGNIPPDHFGRGEFQDASSNGTNDSFIFKEAIGNSTVCLKPGDLPGILYELQECYAKLKPFHVQIPINVQKAEFDPGYEELLRNYIPPSNHFQIHVSDKEKTVLFVGQKALQSTIHSKLKRFVKKNKIPLVTDMKTRGILSEIEEEVIGYVGFNSDIRALEAFNSQSPLAAEYVIAAGVDHDLINQYINTAVVDVIHIKPAGFNDWLDTFSPDRKIITKRESWLSKLNEIKPPQPVPLHRNSVVSYSELLNTINEVMPDNMVYCLDAGQIRRAGSIFLKCRSPRSLIQSDTLSPMGSGICASIGAQVASHGKRVVALFGDGSMRMHGMELATAVRYKLPIIFILCDNQSYASVKAQESVKELPETNWGSYAELIGIKSFFINDRNELSKQLKQALTLDEPTLLWTIVPGLLEDELEKTKELEYKNWLFNL